MQVDGVACAVSSATFYEIKCTTAEGTVNSGTNFAGQHGMRRKTYDDSTSHSSYASTAITTEKLATSYEIAKNSFGSNEIEKLSGYFEAPVDGEYQFHMSCDDHCKFYLSTDPMDPSTKSELIYRRGWLTDYDFRSFATHKFGNVENSVKVDDTTLVDGTTWNELKIDAMDTGYTSTTAYTSLSSAD